MNGPLRVEKEGRFLKFREAFSCTERPLCDSLSNVEYIMTGITVQEMVVQRNVRG